MDDRRIQRHEQAVNYWRNVEQQGREDQAEAQQHIRTERQDEEAERGTKRQGQHL
jgi:hypothetical protein